MKPVVNVVKPGGGAQTCARALVVAFLVCFARSGQAGQSFDGPPAPVAPEVITRDATTGRATILAVRLKEPLRVDGRLDEGIYGSVPPMSDFVQMEPRAGSAATEKTEVWIFFDEVNVYVTFRCWESHPERMVVKEMRRDHSNLWQGENIAFFFDTFHDRRNGVEFGVSPSGGRYEGQVTNERSYNGDWNPVWKVVVGRFEGGWTVEAALPFKSLRYGPGRAQVWGFQARRINAWKNELSFLTRLPPELGMGRGIFAASLAPAVVGLEVPERSKNLEVKPYTRADVTTNRAASPPISNRMGGGAGLDVKYGLTGNLSADVTYNTDFAQVEADEQQLNLTRFSLFFPEKREFFLENQGMFAFGGPGPADMPILFYSRRIGLSQGQAVPINAGGRLTGRVGPFSLGILNIESDNQPLTGAPNTNFSVIRLKRDLGRSSIGLIATRRSAGEVDSAANTAYGADGTFSLTRNLTINAYWARTEDGRSSNDATSYRGQLEYAGDRYGLQLERLVVGAHFDPGIGYVRRRDMLKNYGFFRFSPRPRESTRIRKLYWDGTITQIANRDGRLETRDAVGEFAIDFQNSDHFTVQHERDKEFIPRPFPIAPGITLPVAGYDLETARVGYTLGPQRPFAAGMLAEYGPFYGGRRAALSLSSSRLNPTLRLSVEPIYSINRVTLREGTFTATLAGSRVTFTVTPTMFASALVQYNSSTAVVSTNVRLRWEYQPGSELFVVYSDERDAWPSRAPALRNRSFVIKVNRLFRL
jgi:Domain of unknown function (DUF5916)